MPEETKPAEFKFDPNTIFFLLYMLYKCNILTRHHLRTMTKIIKDPIPGDIVKFLVEEAGRAT